MLSERASALLLIGGIILAGIGFLHTRMNMREPSRFVVNLTWIGTGLFVVFGAAAIVLLWRLLK